ncbi:MAG: TlpA disulfide reductase family protein [Methylococcales bacterium]|nr:TlpA disulfide reductase family protein [Methylococcales bacterium]
MKYRFFIICFLILVISGIWVGYHSILENSPDITFTTITGKKITLKDWRGKAVLVNFWATDCKSCIEEVPDLIALYNKYHSQGLEMVAVTLYYDIPSHVVAMTKAKKIPYDVALDLRSAHANAFGQVQLTPTTFLINPQGQISFKKTGVFDVNAMKKRIETLIQH